MSKTGIPFDAVDGRPVHIFFALLAPLSAGGDHLRALARVSRLLKDPDIRKRFLEARSEAGVLAIINEQDGKY
jgi:PTS system nitrogen regulatory IIA component